jgi:hypothetical protein
MADPVPTTPATAPASPSVSSPPAPRQPDLVAASPSAAKTAPLFGGLRGGNKRKDGLIPGTPEAREADLAKDRARKAAAKAERKGQPPPLPSVGKDDPAAPTSQAPGAVPPVEGAPVAPWEAEMLRPVFEELIPIAEEVTIHQLTAKAAKARLSGDLIKEIESDAKWNPVARKGLELSAPEVTAEVLNDLGIDSKNKAKVVLATSIGAIVAGHVKLLRRLDKIIALNNVPTVKPGEEKKP